MEEVKLLGTWPSPFMYKVIWALKLKGVGYELVEENLHNKSDTLLEVQSHIQKDSSARSPWHTDIGVRCQSRFWTQFGDDKAYFHTVGEEQEKAVKEAKEILKAIEGNGLGKLP